MQQFKTIVIIGIICFIIGILLASGIWGILYFKASGKYAADIKSANDSNKQLVSQLAESIDTNKQLQNIIDKIGKGITDEQGIIKRIVDLNRQAINGLDEGNREK